jgi:hypothetical protein
VREPRPHPNSHPLFQFDAVPKNAALLGGIGVTVLAQPFPSVHLGLREGLSGARVEFEVPQVATKVEELMQCQPKEVLKSIVHRTRIAPLRLTRS